MPQLDGCAMYQLELKAEIHQGGFVQRHSWSGRGCVLAGAEVHELSEMDFLFLFVLLVGLKSLESIFKDHRLTL